MFGIGNMLETSYKVTKAAFEEDGDVVDEMEKGVDRAVSEKELYSIATLGASDAVHYTRKAMGKKGLFNERGESYDD